MTLYYYYTIFIIILSDAVENILNQDKSLQTKGVWHIINY